ncbi:MAG: GNAT family N-acetyltransferase [Myxococcales bacterium]|nr:MAG: GNAT family N-acetyltransferase [Myxococcales bacterium]
MEWKIEAMRALYESRLTTAANAISHIKAGSRIYVGTGCALPQYLVGSLVRYGDAIDDAEVVHLVSLADTPFTDPRYCRRFRLNAFFIGEAAREAVRRGDADYTPVFLSEVPGLIHSGQLSLDVALVQVTPPDPYGNCSLGVSVETTKAAVERAAYVIAQVNPRLPRTAGDSFVSVKELDALIEHEEPVLEFHPPEPDEVAEKIGFYASRLVPDGATIQAGIGSIPNAVLKHLKDKRDLGVHTEMFSDGLIDLYEAGVITGRKKTLRPGKIVAAFCLGTRRLYEMIDDNPDFEFRTTDYVSDPRRIALNDNMAAINSALEIDLTGQVCADSIGTRFFSGFGGQADFIRGAALAKGGRPIIALPSTARGGEASRIVPTLKAGAGVVTTRGDVHYVVTEYGIAYLHGKTIRQRALALINIAHPRFRASLLEEAKALSYVYPDQTLPPPGSGLYMEKQYWTYAAPDGRTAAVRPLTPADEEDLRHLFYSLTDTDIYYRFMGTVKTLRHAEVLPLVVLDYEEKFAVGAWAGEEPAQQLVGVARWFLDRKLNRAELAVTVGPDWQGKRLGKYLFNLLLDVARQKGVAEMSAEVLGGNRRMMAIIAKCGYNIHTRLEEGVYSVIIYLNEKRAEPA